jgi:hypothetical protein
VIKKISLIACVVGLIACMSGCTTEKDLTDSVSPSPNIGTDDNLGTANFASDTISDTIDAEATDKPYEEMTEEEQEAYIAEMEAKSETQYQANMDTMLGLDGFMYYDTFKLLVQEAVEDAEFENYSFEGTDYYGAFAGDTIVEMQICEQSATDVISEGLEQIKATATDSDEISITDGTNDAGERTVELVYNEFKMKFIGKGNVCVCMSYSNEDEDTANLIANKLGF